MPFGLRDSLMKIVADLPSGAETINSDALDLRGGAKVADFELLLTVPALTTAQLPDTETVKYTIQTDDDSAFGSPTALHTDAIVQTGAGGAGAAGATHRFRVPSNAERYLRVAATKSDAADASDEELTLEVLF